MFKKLFCLTVFVVLLAFLATSSIATDYYVAQNDPAADDSNPGTEALPWETLTKACETVVAGDTVYVKAGTYIDTVNIYCRKFEILNNGTAANPITFISSPPRAAVVRSASLPGSRFDYAWGLKGGSKYIIIDGFKIEGGIVAAYDRAEHCTIRNCELVYGREDSDPTLNWGITLYWANYCTVENNYVHDITSSGSNSRNTGAIFILGKPEEDPIEYCEYNIFQGNTVDAGFNVRNCYGMKGGGTDNNIWRYNVAMNAGVGYHGMGTTGGRAFDIGYAFDRFLIYNNTAVDCGTFLGAYRSTIFNTEMWNNILQGTNGTVIPWDCYPDATPFTTLIAFSNYNCFYNFSKFAYRENSPTLNYYTLGDWQNATGYDMDTITSNPLLVGGGDYHLQGGSPCINAGVDLQDYDDDQNTSESINMGAYITGSEIIGHNWGPTPPGQATSPSPSDSATDVSVTADLSWTAGSGSTSSDVYFGTDSTPDSGEFQGNQTATTYDPGTMSNNTTYYWRIDEINAQGTTTGNVWSFTTEAVPSPPGQASSPNPADSATDVSTTTDLSWTAGSGTTSHDVYFGTTSPGTFQGNQTATTFDPGTMANDTTYYWRIDEVNAQGTTTGNVWSFTTEAVPSPPGQASSPGPADSATDVSINADLSWTAGSGATSHDVYFGTSSPGTFQGNQTATTFDPGTMANDTTYYWRIDAVNTAGTTTGNVWSFTTVTGGGETIKINFQLLGADIPTGYEPDYGDAYGDRGNGLSYGWDVTNDETRDREAVPDQRYDTLNHLQKLADRTWEIGLSNDTYDVWLVCGDPTYPDMINTMDVEGTVCTDPDGQDDFDEYNIQVSVSDGRFTISPAAGSDNAKICFIEITPAGAAMPGQATNPSPADSATGVSTTADLSWTDGSGATSHDVYFGTSSPGSFQGNQTANTFDPGAMANDTTYYWRIDEVNANGTTTGAVWSFTTIVAAPSQASNPDPADSATDVSNTAILSWSAGSGATSRDVYFGTSSPGDFQGNQTETTYDPGTLSYDVTYYWRIDEVNAAGTTTGNVWTFTTQNQPQPPGQASNPSPADTATDVDIDADLSWTAGSGSTSSDVYFGTTSPGSFQGNQTETTYDTGTMDNDTTYYWRIDEVNANGTTTGNVWSFTTVTAGGQVTEEFGDAVDTNYPGTIEDTYTNAGSGGDDNWSTDVTLNTYTWPADTTANTTIIKWDLSAISTDATVVEATLYLYQVETGGDTS
ncbi:MAG: right-handed parallel beta-helix repeat-containing protein, partial [Planctomycetota bacterium]